MSTSADILHVDLDAFFAAVEVLDNPELLGKAVIVGNSGGRGVVASCSYEARAFGVRSAMSSVQARRLCPHAIFVNGRHSRYKEYSDMVYEVFDSFTPLVEPLGLDEAFLDVSGARKSFGSPESIGHQIRRAIQNKTGLTASVGVAASKLMAKLASEAAKPSASSQGAIPGAGVVVVEPGRELSFLRPLPVRALWGIGPAAERKLHQLGVKTVGDLTEIPLDSLRRSFGRSLGDHLHSLARADDHREVVVGHDAKSVGHEETYAVDLSDRDAIRRELVKLCDAIASRARESSVSGKTVSIKVRFGDFTTFTRSKSLNRSVNTSRQLFRIVSHLSEEAHLDSGIRLLGVYLSGISDPDDPEQLDFEQADLEKDQSISSAVDKVRERFGAESLGSAILLGKAGLRVKRRGDQQWGPNDAGHP